MQDVLSVSEVAALYGVHIESVRRWLREGTLGGYRLGAKGDWRIPREALDRFEMWNPSGATTSTGGSA